MESLPFKPREKDGLFHDGEGTDRDFEGDGGCSKELEINLDTIQKANLFNQICEGESVVMPSNKTDHIDIVDQDDTSIDDVSVGTNLLNIFLETLVGRDEAASTTTALALLEENSGIEVCQRLLKKWKQLSPLTRKVITLVAELKKTNKHLTMNGLNRAEKEVKVLNEETDASEESSDTPIRLYKKTKHTHVSGGKAPSTKAMGIDIQEEILMDILSRLPVLPLLRFKCVSKFWNTLISDPYFNMKHQRHHENDLNSQKLLVAVNMSTFFSSSLSTVQLVENVQNHDCPSNCKPVDYCNIYCSCDGLVLVGVHNRYDKQLLLWNPSTRESTVLPYPEFVTRSTTFGLGYDATSDGYIILKLERCLDEIHLPTSYEFLVLKSGSWRKIRNYPSRIFRSTGYAAEINPTFDEDDHMEPLAFLHGAFHWVGYLENYSVVSFSSSDKVFREISLPEPSNYRIYGNGNSDYGVSVLGGMLCFYCTHVNPQRQGTFKLWVMKDYGVKESWTKIFTLKVIGFCSVVPKYRFADGELLLCCRSLGCSVFRTSKGPFGLWPQIDINQDRVVYKESLISPKSLC